MHGPGGVGYWVCCDSYSQLLATLLHSESVGPLYGFFSTNSAIKEFGKFFLMSGRMNYRKVTTEHFVFGIAVKPLRGAAPTGNQSIEVMPDYCLRNMLHDGIKLGYGLGAAMLFRKIFDC